MEKLVKKESGISVTKDTKKSKTEMLTGNYDFWKMMPEGLSGISEDMEILVLRARAIRIKLNFS